MAVADMRPETQSRTAGDILRLVVAQDGVADGTASAAAARSELEASAFDADLSRTFAALGGLTARRRLHAVHPAHPGDEGAATGFSFTLLGTLFGQVEGDGNDRSARPFLWVQDRCARLEAGRPYGLGFKAFGLDPGQAVLVETKGAQDALAAAEIGLEIGGIAGVLVELPRTLPADMLAFGKRLALRAERSATPCLLLHASAAPVAAPVATRWLVASLPAMPAEAWRMPVPRADLTLQKNRFGQTGRWSIPLGFLPLAATASLPGDRHAGIAAVSSPLSQPLAAHPADRSRPAPGRIPEQISGQISGQIWAA